MESWEVTIEMIRTCAQHQGGGRIFVDEVNRTEVYAIASTEHLTSTDRGLADSVPLPASDWWV